MIKKILLADSGRKFFVKDLEHDFHTQFGYVTAAALKKAKPGAILKTNTGTELVALAPQFIDLYQKIARGPQVITPKDIGTIIAETGIGKTSTVVDAGGGSGALTFFLAHLCRKVTTYEVRSDFARLLEGNKALLGMKNITIKNKDVCQGIDEKNLDLITLDLPEPWHALVHATQALKPGGFLVTYNPSITQAAQLVEAVKQSRGMQYLKTKEVLERKWEIDGRKVRPYNRMLAHTGFLVFCRKTG